MQTNESKNQNKKIIFSIIAVIVLLLALFIVYLVISKKAKSDIPEDISKYFYEQGVIALEIMDDYIDGSISYAECYDTMDSMFQTLSDEYERTKSSIPALESASNLLVVNRIHIFRETIKDEASASEVIDARNRLAETLDKEVR